MKQLFLCERPYALYRTIVRAIQSTEDIDILLGERTPGLTRMAGPLRESGIFRHVFVYQDPYYADFHRYEDVPYPFIRSRLEKLTRVPLMLGRKLLAYARYQRQSKKLRLPEGLELSAYDEIYVDELPSAAHFYLLHREEIPLICVEHGNNCFQNYKSYAHTRFLNRLDRMRLLYATRGCSRRYAAVEVSDDRNLLSELSGKEIRVLSMDGMVKSLSPAQKERIFGLYCDGFDVRLNLSEPYDVVLTSPVFRRAVFDPQFQLAVFSYVIREYTQGAGQVIIKPHPMDITDYTGVDPRCTVVPIPFPGEVLGMSRALRVRRVITVISSSISTFAQAEERIVLGLDFVNQFDDKGRRKD